MPKRRAVDQPERANRERLRRRSHLIRLRTSAINRTFGLQTQWGLRRNTSPALRKPGALDELAEHGVPEVWRQSIATLLGVIDDLDRQLAPLERELRPHARADERVQLLMTIPGVAELLGLTLAAEIGEVSRFPSAAKLVGYSGLIPTIKQSGQSSRTGRLSKAGPNTLRWAAVEAAQQAWRPSNPWHALYSDIKRRHAANAYHDWRLPRLATAGPGHALYTDIKRRHGKSNPARAALARKVLIAAWHVLSLQEPFKPSASRARPSPGKLLHSSGRLTAHKRSENRDSCNPTTCAAKRRKRSQHPAAHTRKEGLQHRKAP